MAKSTSNTKRKNPNIDDIGNISEIIKQISETSNSIVGIIDSLDKVVTAAATLSIKKRLILHGAKSAITDYISLLEDIISQISQITVGSGKDLKDILGYQETMNETITEVTENNGRLSEKHKTITDGKYPLIDFMTGFATMISNMIEPLEKIMSNPIFIIAGTRFGRFMRIAVDGFATMLGDLISTVFKSISSIDTSKMVDAVSMLVGSPETVTKIDKSRVSEQSDSKIDQKSIKEITTGKKMGVLELITGLLGVMETIYKSISLNPSKIAIMHLRISMFGQYIKETIESILGILDETKSTSDLKKQYADYSEIFTSIGNIVDAVSMLDIPDTTTLLKGYLRLMLYKHLILNQLHNKKGGGLLDELSVVFNNPDIKRLVDEDGNTASQIEGLKEIISGVSGVVMLMSQIGVVNIIRARLVGRLLQTFISNIIPNIINAVLGLNQYLTQLQQYKAVINSTQAIVAVVSSIVKSVVAIESMVILGALLTLPFIIASPLFVVGVQVMVWLLCATRKAFNAIAKLAPSTLANAGIVLLVVGIIATTMLLVTATLLGIAAMFEVIIDCIPILLKGLGILGMVLIAFMVVSWLVGYVAPFILLGAITTALVVYALTITIVGFTIMAVLLIGLTYIYSLMNPAAILEATKGILGLAYDVIKAVLTTDFGMRDEAAANTRLIGGLARMLFGGQAATIIDLMQKISILTLVIITVVVLMILVGVLVGLEKFIGMYRDVLDLYSSSDDNNPVKVAMKATHSVIDAILNSENSDFGKKNNDDGIVGFLLGLVGGGQLRAIFDLIMKVSILLLTVITVGIMIVMVNLLVELKKVIDKAELGDIETKVGEVMSTVSAVVSQITGSNISFGTEPKSKFGKWVRSVLPDSLNSIADAIKTLGKMGTVLVMIGMVNTIAKQADKVSKTLQKYKSVQNLAPNVSNLLKTVTGVAASLNSLDDNADLKGLVDKSKSYSSVVKDTDKLINKVNGLNIDKMKTLAEMFGNAAAFAKSINGNFDKLADVINEKLAPILQELKQAIEDADKHITERKNNPAPVVTTTTPTAAPAATPTPAPKAKPEPKKPEPRVDDALVQAIIDALTARHVGRD